MAGICPLPLPPLYSKHLLPCPLCHPPCIKVPAIILPRCLVILPPDLCPAINTCLCHDSLWPTCLGKELSLLPALPCHPHCICVSALLPCLPLAPCWGRHGVRSISLWQKAPLIHSTKGQAWLCLLLAFLQHCNFSISASFSSLTSHSTSHSLSYVHVSSSLLSYVSVCIYLTIYVLCLVDISSFSGKEEEEGLWHSSLFACCRPSSLPPQQARARARGERVAVLCTRHGQGRLGRHGVTGEAWKAADFLPAAA